MSDLELRRALGHWPELVAPRWSPLGAGLINQTYAVRSAGRELVIQRVSPIFDPTIHHNIRAVTDHLASRGMSTPRLVPAADGADWIDLGPDGVWRLMTRVPGVTFDRPQSPGQVRAAGALLGRFHGALEDLDHAWSAGRRGVHDTQRHLHVLRVAVEDHGDHRLFEQVAPLAEAVLEQAQTLPPPPDAPARPVHGDPKLNNMLFAGATPPASEETVCLVDLDTVGAMPRWQELGDALRSWCNGAGEDSVVASFDPELFRAAVQGYTEGIGGLETEAREFLADATRWISLELAARFLADALRENYFGWDRAKFAGRGEHNLARGQGQWSLCQAVRA